MRLEKALEKEPLFVGARLQAIKDSFKEWARGVQIKMDRAQTFARVAAQQIRDRSRPLPPDLQHLYVKNIRDGLESHYHSPGSLADASAAIPQIMIPFGRGKPSARFLRFELVDSGDDRPSYAHYLRQMIPGPQGLPTFVVQIQKSVFRKGVLDQVLQHEILEPGWRVLGMNENEADRRANALQDPDLLETRDLWDVAPYSPGWDQ